MAPPQDRPTDSTGRLREAVDLVLHDVAVVLGDGAVAVVPLDELDSPYVAALVASDPDLLDELTRLRTRWTPSWASIIAEHPEIGSAAEGGWQELAGDLVDPTDPTATDLSVHEPSSEWWVFVPCEESTVGLSDWNNGPFEDLVEQTAEIVQEVIMESERFRGAAFPPCPEHPNTPLWGAVIDGRPVWCCIDVGTTAIPVGMLEH